jgi:erythromycin esterase
MATQHTDTDTDEAAARYWISTNAHTLATTDPAAPLTDLAPLEAMLSGAQIVGIGETTRAGHEVVSLAHRVLRLLVERLGFRVLAIQEDETVVAALDGYVRTGAGDPHEAIARMWVPWRTQEMLAVVKWARAFNQRNPADPVRLVGLEPATAQPAHYRAVLDHVAVVAPDHLDEVRRHYDAIATAHEIPEHVQHARGVHPGRPFADRARDAYDLVASLPSSPGESTALADARLILDFHAGSFAAGGFDYAATRRRSVATMTTLRRDGHTKIAYWEGVAFTANAPRLEPVALLRPFRSVGNQLRRLLGTGYVSLLLGFGEGDVSQLHPGQHVPPPMPGSADAALAASDLNTYLLDLHAPRTQPVTRWLHGPHQLRIVAGIYDAAADTDHYLTTGPLDQWFDAILHVHTITPTKPL